MPDRKIVLLALATVLIPVGVPVLTYAATGRPDWWTDPIFWVGALALAGGVLIFVWLLVPSWLRDRRAFRERQEQALREGRANQRQGLDEIARELGAISSQLKAELRWGERKDLFPNTAWTKNQHLVTGEARPLVDEAYEQAHLLDKRTLAATKPELDEEETKERESAKKIVDAASDAVRGLRDGIQP